MKTLKNKIITFRAIAVRLFKKSKQIYRYENEHRLNWCPDEQEPEC